MIEVHQVITLGLVRAEELRFNDLLISPVISIISEDRDRARTLAQDWAGLVAPREQISAVHTQSFVDWTATIVSKSVQ